MSTPADNISSLRASLAALEAQRAALGDAIIEPAVRALRQKIELLELTAPPFSARATAPETRRLITILFMDVVGSTTMAEKMDAEEWRQIVSRLMETVGACVVEHKGAVAQYMGDGMLAFFGADRPREHDAENAIRAGLAMQMEVARVFDPAMNIRIRVGINSGPVVLGGLGTASHKEFTAIGDAMNTAARVQSEAPPGGVLISHDTYRYVRGVFDVTPRQPVLLKGKTQPVATYLVRRAKPRAFRTVTRGVAGIEARTVGRTRELQALQNAFLDMLASHAVVWAHVNGIAGVGKTRLVAEFNSWSDLREEVFRLFRARAVEGDERQPFALLRWLLFDRFQISEDTQLAQAEAKWVQKFAEMWNDPGADLTEPAHALGLLLGLPFESSPHLAGMRVNPAQVKGRALVVAAELFQRIRLTHPVVLGLEDLQWADASSCEALGQILAAPAGAPPPHGVLVVSTSRPEWKVPDSLHNLMPVISSANGTRSSLTANPLAPHGAALTLAPLTGEASRELVLELLQPLGTPPPELTELIVERAEGMPYYVEELVNWCCDHGIIETASEPWRFVPEKLHTAPLPVTLQHLLLTRVSALPEHERVALQHGAIFGRHFWTGGVRALGHERAESLDELRSRGFVEAQPESSFVGDTEWSFHHSLLRDVTYETVLKRDRASLHRQAAAWLETQAAAAGRLEEFTGLLGEHCERAGETLAAADWQLRAAGRAKDRGAAPEAYRAYSRALELVPREDTARRWHALLGREESDAMLANVEAWDADLVALQKLAAASHDSRRIAEVHYRAAEFHRTRGNFGESRRLADLAELAARGAGDAAFEAKARALRGMAEVRQGDVVAGMRSSESALTQARALDDPALLALVLFRHGFCCTEGNRDNCTAVSIYQEQIELDRAGGRNVQLATGQLNLGVAFIGLGQYKRSRAVLEQALPILADFGVRRPRAYTLLNLGCVLMFMAELTRSRTTLEQALVEMDAVGDAFGRVATLLALGRTLEKSRDLAGAQRRFAEGRVLAENKGFPAILQDLLVAQGRIALAQARLVDARSLACRVWEHLHAHGGDGTHDGSLAFVSCIEIFDATDEDDLARAAAAAGWARLADLVRRIPNPMARASMLENEPDNRALVGWCERFGIATTVEPPAA